MPPEGHLLVDGSQLEYRFWPAAGPEGPTLALLHEGLGSVTMWRDFPERLSRATGLAVFAWSRAGYGGSSPIPLPRSLSYMHDEAHKVLPKVLAAAGIGTSILVGHSDGASIAAIYAGSRPAGLKGLVLMAPHFFVEDVSITSIAAAKQAFESTDLRQRLARYHGANVDCAFWGWNSAWLDPAFLNWNITEYLSQIRVPVLAIQGEDDEYGTLAQLETAKSLIAGPVRTCVLPACGHSPHRDQPQRTVSAIASFVSEALPEPHPPCGGGQPPKAAG